uniref:Uncharacterized protein n=1 Tax=Arundo donax TaxID=35708 RepID=A0A0A8YLI7_ARUDO
MAPWPCMHREHQHHYTDSKLEGRTSSGPSPSTRPHSL